MGRRERRPDAQYEFVLLLLQLLLLLLQLLLLLLQLRLQLLLLLPQVKETSLDKKLLQKGDKRRQCNGVNQKLLCLCCCRCL